MERSVVEGDTKEGDSLPLYKQQRGSNESNACAIATAAGRREEKRREEKSRVCIFSR